MTPSLSSRHRFILWGITLLSFPALQWWWLQSDELRRMYRSDVMKRNATRIWQSRVVSTTRILSWDAERNLALPVPVNTLRMKPMQDDESSSSSSSSSSSDDDPPPNTEKCTLQEWQTTSFPSCNSLHELWTSPLQVEYLTKGTITRVFSVLNPVTVTMEKIVLKTQAQV
jgi:hypothetical protein